MCVWHRVVCGRSRSSLATIAGCSDRCCSGVCLCLRRVSGYYVRKATTTSIHISSHNIVHTRTYHSMPYLNEPRSDRPVAQAASCRFPTAYARGRSQTFPYGPCRGEVALGQAPLPVHRLPPVITPPVSHTHSFVFRRRCII